MAKVFQVDSDGTLTTNLIAYYKLEDATDYWSTFNLTNVGAVTFEGGKVNNAAQYGELSDRYLKIADSLGVDGGAFSMAVWVKIATAPANNTVQSIAHQFNTNTKVGYQLYYYNNGGTFQIVADRYKRGVASQIVTTNFTLTVGTWYHIVLTYDGTNVKLFIDTVAKGTTAASGNGSTNDTTDFSLGTRITNDNPIQIIKGMIDETGAWSKALSTTEIADLYNSGAGQTMVEGVIFHNLRRKLLMRNM